ncbi:MAG: VWA domain-containing protein [Clostridia bacterium]|nr:VWA domain-containing protein [Clostridia bacterium]
MSSISFDNVWLLFLALPLVVLFAVPFAIAIRKDNVNGHNIASIALHVVMAALIAFAAAGTQINTIVTETDVYVVADVSFSANRNLDTVDEYIANLSLPKHSKLGIVCFGKDHKVVSGLDKPRRSVKNSGVDDTESNISEALEYTGTLFKDGVLKRIVLITDGRETYPEDANKLKRTVDALVAKNIKVDAIFLDDNINSDTKEVQISGADYTKSTFIDRPASANVHVQSNCNTTATVTLYKNGMVLGGSKAVALTFGSNNITFNLDTFEAGTFDYRVVINAQDDGCGYNNSYSFTQTVSENFNVLLITSKASDADYLQSLYGENATVDSYVNDPNIPANVEDLAKYDQIVLSDVQVNTLYNYELFIQSLDQAVTMFGKSLLTFGDLGIQTSADGELNALDDILPIKYGATVTPKLYTLCIDVSHSMRSGFSRFQIAKLAGIQLVNTLKDDDYIRLMTFSGNARSLFYGRVGPNREKLLDTIRNLQTEQGTYVGLGLKTVMESIVDSDFQQKQVMLITDGLPFKGIINYGGSEYEGMTDKQVAEEVVTAMTRNGIHTSVLQVGGSSSAAETGGLPETDWLKQLAFRGGGTHYLAASESELGTVIFGDIQEDEKPKVTDSWVNVERPREKVLTGMNTTLAYVSDYVLGKTKSSATEVLSATYQSGKYTNKVPLFAYWSKGNGMASSYSGKLNQIKNRGFNDIQAANNNNIFFGNVKDTLMPAEKVDYPFVLQTDIDAKTVRITVTPAELHPRATAKITVTAPDGEITEEPLVFNSTGYNYSLKASQIGKYAVSVAYTYGGTEYVADTAINISYEPEYDLFNVFEASVLYKMVGSNGTVSENGKLEIVSDPTDVATFTIKLAVPLLAVTAVLYVADIAIRKLKWKDIVSLFEKVGRKKKEDKK